jgi:N-acetylmuramoyl-L-alanine amidase
LKIRRVLPALLALAFAGVATAQRLSPLATQPNWTALDKYQESITREDFLFLLESVYAPGGAWKPFITIGDRSASIQTSRGQAPFVLRFAASQGAIKPASRFWRQKAQMPARPAGKPLNGVRIALDPGHLGGSWARMEERWFRIGNARPVTEGDMTLLVAKLLVPRLQALGAEVYLTRRNANPVTPLRANRLQKAAATSLLDKEEPATPETLKTEAEKLFYRVGEIRDRAQLINERLRPDLVVCLHFNAEAWGDPAKPALTDKNHLHLLITGSFSDKELLYDDQRFAMLQKLLSRAFREELAISESVAAALARDTKLPPYQYTQASAIKLGSSPYVWARNLLANRLFQCPVVYVEPYVMNSQAVFDRVQAGDYEGTRAVGGRMQKSIFREYADAVARGLADYYSSNP